MTSLGAYYVYLAVTELHKDRRHNGGYQLSGRSFRERVRDLLASVRPSRGPAVARQA